MYGGYNYMGGYQCCYPTHCGKGNFNNFVLIVVLFILLIIVGATAFYN
ncbi:hypothetical protein N781_06965 [Pontibacillus halophilus JSM 076056 = DSM 19796]|uniref:YjcZ family sporulation protein n=1 Tax=Pontibacillus halophilus JSM 076056 = DSM 19796 TaxID=1385510 RepID=A0A0A5GH58_9BACI|nr:YjcZ family sporulation protein [Pontibacillus halophilus]KGX90528.1 hypothetical protein N781_06965 [Pontibacillus halophilus JSM 076056 = DSM 19796]